MRRAHTDSSYLSANDVRVHFGLGGNANIESLIVDGQTASVRRGIRLMRTESLRFVRVLVASFATSVHTRSHCFSASRKMCLLTQSETA